MKLPHIFSDASGFINRFFLDDNFSALNNTSFIAADSYLSGDGSDESVQFLKMLADANAAKAPIIFDSAKTYNVGVSSFTIDLTKTSLNDIGGASLQWSGAPSLGYGIRFIGTSDYVGSYKASKTMILPNILGSSNPSSLFSGSGIQFGDGTTFTHSFAIRGNVQGFQNTLKYTSNTWWIKCAGRFTWGNIDTPASPVNFGEAFFFDNAIFNDGPVLTLNSGNWTFIGGSIDNSTINVTGGAQVAMYSPHFENPGSSANTFTWVNVQDSESLVSIYSPELVMNDPGGAGITDCPFIVSATNKTGGIVINNPQYSQQSFYSSNVSDDYIALCRSGGGRFKCVGNSPRAFTNNLFYISSANSNLLGNGGFESATLSPWVSSGTGVSARDSTQHIVGKRITSNFSARLDTTSVNTYVQLLQNVRCNSGDLVSLQAYAKGDGIAGHNGQIKLEFLDASGAVISGSSIAASVPSTSNSWTLYRLAIYAPTGAVNVSLTLNNAYASANGSIYYDEIILEKNA